MTKNNSLLLAAIIAITASTALNCDDVHDNASLDTCEADVEALSAENARLSDALAAAQRLSLAPPDGAPAPTVAPRGADEVWVVKKWDSAEIHAELVQAITKVSATVEDTKKRTCTLTGYQPVPGVGGDWVEGEGCSRMVSEAAWLVDLESFQKNGAVKY